MEDEEIGATSLSLAQTNTIVDMLQIPLILQCPGHMMLEAEEQQRFELAANINELAANMSANIYEVTATMDVLRTELKQELAVTMNITNAAIGFSALLSATSLPRGTPIKYTDVKVNKGGRYSTITGKFTASVAALY